MTAKRRKGAQRFAICIHTDDPDLLTPRMVYQVLPDENAAKSDYIRVIDNEGEDYLYPTKYFELVDFPQPIKRALLRTSVPVMRSPATKRRGVAAGHRKNV
jgi:hypothetical protein